VHLDSAIKKQRSSPAFIFCIFILGNVVVVMAKVFELNQGRGCSVDIITLPEAGVSETCRSLAYGLGPK
jgi:hypothetical protein